MASLDPSKPIISIKIGPLWAWQNLWGYGRKVHAKFWLWGMPWDLFYDHLWVLSSGLIFLILDILKYVREYEGIWVYEGI